MEAIKIDPTFGEGRLSERIDSIDFESIRDSFRKHILTEVGIATGFVSDLFLQSREDQHTAAFIDLVIDKLGTNNVADIAKAMTSEQLNDYYDEFEALNAASLQVKVINRTIHQPTTLPHFDYTKLNEYVDAVNAPTTRYTKKMVNTLSDIKRLISVISRDGRDVATNKRIAKLSNVVNDEMRITRIYDQILGISKTLDEEEERLFMNDHCSVEICFHERGGLVAVDFSRVGSLDTIIVGGYALDHTAFITHGEPIHEVIRGILAKGGDVLNFPAKEEDRPLFGMRDVTEEDGIHAF